MTPPTGTGLPVLQVQREFDGNRLALDHQARAYQKLLSLIRRLQTRTSVTGQLGGNQPDENSKESLVGQEGVAA